MPGRHDPTLEKTRRSHTSPMNSTTEPRKNVRPREGDHAMKSRGRTKVQRTMVLNWLRKICAWPNTTEMRATARDGASKQHGGPRPTRGDAVP